MPDATVHHLEGPEPIGNEQLFAGFAEHQKYRGLARATIDRRRYSLAGLARYIAPVPVAIVRADLLEEWLGLYIDPATRHAYLADVRALFRWAIRRAIVPADPTVFLDSVAQPHPLPAPIGDADWRTVFDSADQRLQLVLLFGALAGLRRAEIAARRVDECSEDLLIVRHGKGGRDRALPMHPLLWAAIRAYPIQRGWFFPAAAGGPVDPGTIGVWVRQHFAAVGVTSTLHKARHRFGTQVAAASNGNVFAIRYALGHQSLASAEHYVQFDPAVLRDIIRRLTA